MFSLTVTEGLILLPPMTPAKRKALRKLHL
jgi:hypothetical protein